MSSTSYLPLPKTIFFNTINELLCTSVTCLNAYFKDGRNFEEDWSVWTALETYLQIQEEFGWEPFQKFFDEYNNLPEKDWPKTQQEKNDQLVIRLSKATGKNLYPFWKVWNLPLSDSVDKELKDLPVWEDHPVMKYVKEK